MDKDLIIQTGKKKGLTNKEHIEKDYFQDLILSLIFKHTNKLVFKGGTALYKVYKMSRFSEVLDFTMFQELDVNRLIKKIANALKAGLKTKKVGQSILFKIRFNGIITDYNTVRIDVNLKNTIIKPLDVKVYIPEYVDINPFNMRLLKPEEMLAEKIHSLLSRTKARDLYDLFYLLRITSFDEELTKKKLKMFNMRFDEQKLLNSINNIEHVWNLELKPFLLGEVPKYSVIKSFVTERLKIKQT